MGSEACSPKSQNLFIFPAKTSKTAIDGEPSMELHQRLLDGPRRPHLAAKIKEEVHMVLNQATDSTGCTFMPRPGFVYLIVNDPGGVSASTDHTSLA